MYSSGQIWLQLYLYWWQNVFIFTFLEGKIDLNEENVFQVLSSGNFLQLNIVSEHCCEYLSKNLCVENCLLIHRFAKEQSIVKLEQAAFTYMLDNFERLVNSPLLLNEFTDAELVKLFEDENLNVNMEEFVYEALMTWINLNKEERVDKLAKLLAKVKLPLLEASFLTKEIENNELLLNNIECQALMLEATIYHINPDKFRMSPIFRTIPRKSTQGFFICFGGLDLSNKSAQNYFMEKYDYRTEKWTPIKYRLNASNASNLTVSNNFPNVAKRSSFATAYFGNNLYVVGGCEGVENSKTLNTVECFDLNRHTWTLVTPQMLSRRHGLQATFLNKEPILYAIGGHDGRNFLNSVER